MVDSMKEVLKDKQRKRKLKELKKKTLRNLRKRLKGEKKLTNGRNALWLGQGLSTFEIQRQKPRRSFLKY